MSCLHCHQPSAEGESFCCPGCRLVFETIQGGELAAYYNRRQQPGLKADWQPPDEESWNLQAEGFLKKSEQGALARLALEGLHCGACVWLVEKGLGELEGVSQARVHYADSLVRVAFDPQEVQLGGLMTRLAHLGYRATPLRPEEQRGQRLDLDLLVRMAVAGFGAGNIMMVAAALYLGQFQGIEETFRVFFEWICLALATPVVLYSGGWFLTGAWRAWRARSLTMDVPIAIGILATYGYSLCALLAGSGEVYFDTVTVFIFVLLIGRYLESCSRRRLGNTAEQLLALRPSTARLADGRLVEVEQLQPGDRVVVESGQSVPTDCRVVEGQASFDESLVTGESQPVFRGLGQRLVGGTRVFEGRVTARVDSVGEDTVLARLVDLVEQAQASKSRTQTTIDRVAGVFVAITLSLAALTALLWWGQGPEKALVTSVSVLIITCPCALGLAAPMALWKTAQTGLKDGILFRDLEVIEEAAGVDYVVLDKTGTLTGGRFEVIETSHPEALELAAAANRDQDHPLAAALLAAASQQREVTITEVHPGLGVQGHYQGKLLRVGSARWLRQQGFEVSEWDGRGSLVYVALDSDILGLVELEDTLRPDSTELVQSLKSMELDIEVASGDRRPPVERAARSLGLKALWEVGPEAKRRRVEKLEQGHRVAFLGDGVNDAPALATASVGVAVAGGTAVAASAASILLLRPGLGGLARALELCRQARARIGGNLAISALYNVIAIPAAMAGWVTPLGAALAMPVASLLVVANSLRGET